MKIHIQNSVITDWGHSTFTYFLIFKVSKMHSLLQFYHVTVLFSNIFTPMLYLEYQLHTFTSSVTPCCLLGAALWFSVPPLVVLSWQVFQDKNRNGFWSPFEVFITKARKALLQCIRHTSIIHPSSKQTIYQCIYWSTGLPRPMSVPLSSFSVLHHKSNLISDMALKLYACRHFVMLNKPSLGASNLYLRVTTQSDSFNHNKPLSKLYLPASTSVCL